MKVGVPAAGEAASRAAHSLAAHPAVDQLVIIGPANSRYYQVVEDPSDCDLLVVTGPDAPSRHASSGVPMVWDGPQRLPGVVVWGASPLGLALALAERENDPEEIAVAHPDLAPQLGGRVRFPDPVGRVGVAETAVGGRSMLAGKPNGSFAAVMVKGRDRSVAVVDDGAFMTGITLAAGVAVADGTPRPVWGDSLSYLMAVTEMGLVMAESATTPA